MTKRRPAKTDKGASDDALFDAAMRGVVPLSVDKRGNKPPRKPPPAHGTGQPVTAEKKKPRARKTVSVAPESVSIPAAEVPAGAGIDKRTRQRLKRGQLKIDARLDLHGQVQADAHRALHGFVRAGYENDRRMLLVITGKGSVKPGDEHEIMPNRERGILRRNVPRWLNETPVRHMVLSIETARPQHGGDGAYYVLLRRKR
jgi:DNA-nicking Smr family endonuclease